jgi:hypothetical protein
MRVSFGADPLVAPPRSEQISSACQGADPRRDGGSRDPVTQRDDATKLMTDAHMQPADIQRIRSFIMSMRTWLCGPQNQCDRVTSTAHAIAMQSRSTIGAISFIKEEIASLERNFENFGKTAPPTLETVMRWLRHPESRVNYSHQSQPNNCSVMPWLSDRPNYHTPHFWILRSLAVSRPASNLRSIFEEG